MGVVLGNGDYHGEFLILPILAIMCIASSSRDDKLSERVKKSPHKNGTQLGIEPRIF